MKVPTLILSHLTG